MSGYLALLSREIYQNVHLKLSFILSYQSIKYGSVKIK